MSIGNKNKSDLNLYCQKSRIPIPTYTSSTQDGQFISKVRVKDTEFCSTSGYSTKKEAENDAAGVALIALLQKEFDGRSIEEVLAILDQKYPSKNKKKSKPASSSVSVAQSGTQVHNRDAGNSQVQTDGTPGQISGSITQHGGVARTPQVPPPQNQLQQQEPLVEPHVVQKQSQIDSDGPQGVVVSRPMAGQSGEMIEQSQAAAVYSHQQAMMRPRTPGALQQSQVPRQSYQQAMVRPYQPHVVDSRSQQAVVQDPRYSDVARSQGAITMTPKGGGGGAREQDQRTPGQPSASSANVIHHTSHSTTESGGQAPPTQAYAPGPYYYYPMQRYPPANTAAYYGQYYAQPYMQPAYAHQAPPNPGLHWRHPQPHPPHPRLINSNPPGAYPSPSPPPPLPSGQQTVMPIGVNVGTAPPLGARSMAARFPGTAATPPPPRSSGQLQPSVPSSQRPPLRPPPGFSADQSAASPPQTAPNKPLNAIPVTQLTGQGLPCSTAGDVRQDTESVTQKDASKSLNFGHTKKLEELCKTRSLPAPQYKINQDKGKKYFAEVGIGHQSFRTQWPCESMEQAKSIAAMEAMATLAMSMSALSTSDTGNQQQSESSRKSTATSSQGSSLVTTSASSLPSQVAKGQSSTAHTPQDQSLKQQQTLLSTQRPLASPSNTATTVTTDNPPPALQPPSFFTNNNNSPNPPSPSNTTATASTQIQPKPVKQEIQPSPQPQSPASSRGKAMAVNYKQILNIHCQRNHIAHVYDCVASEDAVGYIATVKVSGKVFTSKNHGTKRAAETEAAGEAVKALGLVGPHGEYQPQPQQGQGKSGVGYYGGGGHTQPTSVSQPQGMVSYKNLLQEHMQKQGLTLPHYETERVEEGFKSTVKVHRQGNDESLTFTSSPQPVKKGAEQEAAKAACLELKLIH